MIVIGTRSAKHYPLIAAGFVARALLVAVLLLPPLYWLERAAGTFPSGAFTREAAWQIHDEGEHLIYLGGIVLERNRHTVVGGALGCIAGAAIGGGGAAVVGFFTAGAGFAAIPVASAAGCGMLGLGGAAIGYPLDDYIDIDL
jgi:hypothetical protein